MTQSHQEFVDDATMETALRELLWENPIFAVAALSCDGNSEPPLLCAITGYPCEGDLSHLCEDYGCARKGGLSPHSEENL
jgi:hypothetical protein